jgi:hypothetical protein
MPYSYGILGSHGASACTLPDPGATSPALVAVSPRGDEVYEGSTAYREIGGEPMFPRCVDLATWLIKSGAAKRVTGGRCEACDEDAAYEYEGHLACDQWCLAEIIDEHGLAERVYVQAIGEVAVHGGR